MTQGNNLFEPCSTAGFLVFALMALSNDSNGVAEILLENSRH
jgi:hypothetical protein